MVLSGFSLENPMCHCFNLENPRKGGVSGRERRTVGSKEEEEEEEEEEFLV